MLHSKSRIAKAQKPHKCCECGLEIKKGERYLYGTMLINNPSEKKFKTYHKCLPCAEDIFNEI